MNINLEFPICIGANQHRDFDNFEDLIPRVRDLEVSISAPFPLGNIVNLVGCAKITLVSIHNFKQRKKCPIATYYPRNPSRCPMKVGTASSRQKE